jgi:hypothetical protein
VSIVDGQIHGFHLAIGGYLKVPVRNVIVIHDRNRHIPTNDLTVAYSIFRHAPMAPELRSNTGWAAHGGQGSSD